MEAVVLAGGYATRLWPITRHRAKPLLPLAGEPIIDRILRPLDEEPRIETVYVSTNQRFADDFREHLDDRGYEKTRLAVEPTRDEDEKLGTVGALAELIDSEEVNEDLLVVAGDNLFSFDLSEFVDYFDERGTPCLAAYDVGSRDEATEYGIVDIDGDRVVGFEEKPDDPPSSLVSIACYAFPADSLGALDDYLAGDGNPDAPGYFVEWLHDRENVGAFTFDGGWFDVGTPGSYIDANAHAMDGSRIEDGATVEDTDVGEDVYVMEGATVADSSLESTVVFNDATVRDCTLRGSVVDSDAYVEDLDLSGALVGSHTHINGR
ncbi:MAG: glucose-1-phosphate thymidylyltransferase [Methanobacteriota archaeon]|jgi:glucose-1-phosphate thymidylyltransferase